MADSGQRADLNKDITALFTPLPPGLCRTVDDEAAVLAETLLLTAAKLAPPIRRKQGPGGWYALEGVKAEFHTRWQERERARTRLRAAPNDSSLRKSLKIAKQLQFARAEGVQTFLEEPASQLQEHGPEGDQFGFYKHLKVMGVEGKSTCNSQCMARGR